MPDVLIKPLRAYEDRGTIRDVDNEPYAAPVWLAKELEQLKLCQIVSEGGGSVMDLPAKSDPTFALKVAKKGQRWIVADAQGVQVGDFIGKRDEAETELARLVAAAQLASADAPETPIAQPTEPLVADEDSPLPIESDETVQE
ncbi:hypothetical protein [Pseudomonas graminis]|uniref:Uncharacterized protein n=1 Tax=Pseudomonas graminis TaxID=158627 RepID=A0A1I0H2N8_9PSED|nr:hypothetical protein [Pseudomonas graminis]SET77066.1 hypothetical protein SAMN05216197_12488 [Pseudomonas graminis]